MIHVRLTNQDLLEAEKIARKASEISHTFAPRFHKPENDNLLEGVLAEYAFSKHTGIPMPTYERFLQKIHRHYDFVGLELKARRYWKPDMLLRDYQLDYLTDKSIPDECQCVWIGLAHISDDNLHVTFTGYVSLEYFLKEKTRKTFWNGETNYLSEKKLWPIQELIPFLQERHRIQYGLGVIEIGH